MLQLTAKKKRSTHPPSLGNSETVNMCERKTAPPSPPLMLYINSTNAKASKGGWLVGSLCTKTNHLQTNLFGSISVFFLSFSFS